MKTSECKELKSGDILYPLTGRKTSNGLNLSNVGTIRFKDLRYEISEKNSCITIKTSCGMAYSVFCDAFEKFEPFTDGYSIF